MELTFDEKDRKLSEHEKGMKILEFSRNKDRLRAEETFGTSSGTTGWEGADERVKDSDGFGAHEMERN